MLSTYSQWLFFVQQFTMSIWVQRRNGWPWSMSSHTLNLMKAWGWGQIRRDEDTVGYFSKRESQFLESFILWLALSHDIISHSQHCRIACTAISTRFPWAPSVIRHASTQCVWESSSCKCDLVQLWQDRPVWVHANPSFTSVYVTRVNNLIFQFSLWYKPYDKADIRTGLLRVCWQQRVHFAPFPHLGGLVLRPPSTCVGETHVTCPAICVMPRVMFTPPL